MIAFLLFYLPLASPLQLKIEFSHYKPSHNLPVNITSYEKGKMYSDEIDNLATQNIRKQSLIVFIMQKNIYQNNLLNKSYSFNIGPFDLVYYRNPDLQDWVWISSSVVMILIASFAIVSNVTIIVIYFRTKLVSQTNFTFFKYLILKIKVLNT